MINIVSIDLDCFNSTPSAGNSVKFTAKSPAAAMEWVVAIKEAIRVEKERERREVSHKWKRMGSGQTYQ